MHENLNDPIYSLLDQLASGDSQAAAKLTPLVYRELKAMARHLLRDAPDGQTLNTTALVHETYLKVVGGSKIGWESRSHFFCVAAKAMRQVMVDYARRRRAVKRGGDAQRIPFDEALARLDDDNLDVVALNDALERLAEFDERKSRVVELRFFTGLTNEETAKVLRVSTATVKRDWRLARAWLRRELSEDTPHNAASTPQP